MAFVLDASIALTWAFADEEQPVAKNALNRLGREDALVPTLWWFEVRNILIIGERKGRIAETDTAAFLHILARLPITVDHEPDETQMLLLSRRHKLTIYDSAYLELALRTKTHLATLDKALIAAAKVENVTLAESPL